MKDFVGTGLRFPITVNAHGSLATSSGAERVQDAIWVIVSTSPGERVMRPTFGAGVNDYVFANNSAPARTGLASAIKRALLDWEPRIDVVAVRVEEVVGNESQVLATVEYRLRGTNELFNAVYPLSLTEGVR